MFILGEPTPCMWGESIERDRERQRGCGVVILEEYVSGEYDLVLSPKCSCMAIFASVMGCPCFLQMQPIAVTDTHFSMLGLHR